MEEGRPGERQTCPAGARSRKPVGPGLTPRRGDAVDPARLTVPLDAGRGARLLLAHETGVASQAVGAAPRPQGLVCETGSPRKRGDRTRLPFSFALDPKPGRTAGRNGAASAGSTEPLNPTNEGRAAM